MSQLTCSQLSQAESDSGIEEHLTPTDRFIQNNECQAPQKADYQVLRNQNFTPPTHAPAQSPPPLGQRMSFLSTTSSVNNASNTIIELPSPNVPLTPSQPDSISPSQQPCDKPTFCKKINSSFSRQQDGLFSSNQRDIPREQNATGYEAIPVVQNKNLETTRPSPSQEPTVELAISDLQRNQAVQRWLRRSNLSALNRTSRATCRAFRGSRKRRRKPKKGQETTILSSHQSSAHSRLPTMLTQTCPSCKKGRIHLMMKTPLSFLMQNLMQILMIPI